MSLDDLETVLRRHFVAALDGDAVAYRAFLATITVRLRAFIRNNLMRVGRTEPSEVEDVLQETLLALHLSQHTYDPTSPVSAWAHAIARYKLIDHLRRSGRHTNHLPIEDAEHVFGGVDDVAADTRIDLRRALAALPPRTRRLIEQVKVQGFSVADAARDAGMTETAVKVAVHRGLKALAKALRRT